MSTDLMDDAALLSDLLDEIGAAVCVADPATLTFSYVSRAGERLLGHTAAAWRTPGFFMQRLHPDDKDVALVLWRDAAQGHERRGVHRLVHRDGRAVWVQTRVRPLSPGSALGPQVLGLMVDVTEKLRAEDVLKADELRLKVLLQQLPALLWTVDRDLRFTSCSGAGLAALGVQPGQLTGVSIYDYLHTTDPNHPPIKAHIGALAGESSAYDVDWGPFSYSCRVQPLRSEGEIIGAITCALDVTAQRRAESERDRLLRKTQDALQAGDDFISVASHEMQTPAAALQLAVQALLQAPPQAMTEPQQRLLRVAEQSVKRISAFADQLLDVTRMQAGRLTLHCADMDLAELMGEVGHRFAGLLARARCSYQLQAPAPVRGRWDRLRLDQVITNLLSNAVKYAAGKPVRVRVEKSDAVARLVVADEGMGIEPEHLPHLFGRFERAVSARHYGGLGLGLYIVQRIVEAHQGTVSVDSQPGAGATFMIELPLGGIPS